MSVQWKPIPGDATPIVDGYPMNWEPKPARYEAWPYMLVQSGEEAALPAKVDPAAHTPEAVVSRMKADGMFCVKSFYERGTDGRRDLPAPRLETMRSLVRAAHAAGMPVFLHAISPEAQAFAVEAGVDIIAHGMFRWEEQPDNVTQLTLDVRKVLDGVIDARMGWQPTMQVLVGFRDLADPQYLSDPTLARVVPPELIEWYKSPDGQSFRERNGLPPADAVRWNAVQTVRDAPLERNENVARYLASRNARIVFGTDTPAAPFLYTNPAGMNGWLEMRRLVAGGLTPRQVFVAATLNNATALGLANEIGTVEAGKRANLILLRKDPTQTIEAYDDIVKVVIRGKVIERAELAAKR